MPTETANPALPASASSRAPGGGTFEAHDPVVAAHILNLIHLPVLAARADGRIVLANHAMAEMLGQRADALIGLPVAKFSSPAQAAADAALAQAALTTGLPQSRASHWTIAGAQETPVQL